MHDSASLPHEDWSTLIARLTLLLGVDLDALPRQTKALLQRRGVPDATALLRLALVRGPGGLSLRQTAAWAFMTGVANLTDASLNNRLHQSCDFLAEIVAGLLRAKVPGPCFRRPSRVLRISDGSRVYKPGSKGTDWRVHGVYELGSGGFSHLPADQASDDVAVLIEGSGAKNPLPTRVVILRKPIEAAEAERARLRREASRRGKQLDPRSLLAAAFVILATSLPADYPVDEIFAMYRLRWQIELAFKRLKSLLNIDRLPATSDKGARSWIYAHLIVALLTDAASQDFLESSP